MRPDPSTPTPLILPDTYANATTGARHISLMQSELEEHADGYKYAPEVIEMMDSQYLNEFLDGIPNERLKKQWSDTAQGSGRRFT